MPKIALVCLTGDCVEYAAHGGSNYCPGDLCQKAIEVRLHQHQSRSGCTNINRNLHGVPQEKHFLAIGEGRRSQRA